MFNCFVSVFINVLTLIPHDVFTTNTKRYGNFGILTLIIYISRQYLPQVPEVYKLHAIRKLVAHINLNLSNRTGVEVYRRQTHKLNLL